MKRTILEYPHPLLRETAVAVTNFDDTTRDIVRDLIDTLGATPGIGLCAPQIGHSVQILVTDLSSDKSDPKVFINPEILQRETPCMVEESCLSVPDFVGNVGRYANITVRAQNESGEHFELPLANMEAVCVQHEMDHLQGKLFVDRLSFVRKLIFRATARRRLQQAAKVGQAAA